MPYAVSLLERTPSFYVVFTKIFHSVPNPNGTQSSLRLGSRVGCLKYDFVLLTKIEKVDICLITILYYDLNIFSYLMIRRESIESLLNLQELHQKWLSP